MVEILTDLPHFSHVSESEIRDLFSEEKLRQRATQIWEYGYIYFRTPESQSYFKQMVGDLVEKTNADWNKILLTREIMKKIIPLFIDALLKKFREVGINPDTVSDAWNETTSTHMVSQEYQNGSLRNVYLPQREEWKLALVGMFSKARPSGQLNDERDIEMVIVEPIFGKEFEPFLRDLIQIADGLSKAKSVLEPLQNKHHEELDDFDRQDIETFTSKVQQLRAQWLETVAKLRPDQGNQ
jgi:hypothetical protein